MRARLCLVILALILATNLPARAEEEEDDLGDELSEDEYVTIEEEEPETEESKPEAAKVEEEEYFSPLPDGEYYFHENFDDLDIFRANWVKSESKKEEADEMIAKYDGMWNLEETARDPTKGDFGLVLKSKAKHSAIAALLEKPFHFSDRPLVVQYEVNFQNGQECGGAYLKLLSMDPSPRNKAPQDLKHFHDKTPYTIMFGPDKCGNDHKLHFIFRHKNPLNGSFEEKHAKKSKERIEEPFKDKKPHLYTLVVNPDNTFQILVDHKVVNKGSLLEDVTPAVNPPAEIDDPNDFKPNDWDEREKIPDPEASKPEDWDEDAPAQIPDKAAGKPDGWLDDEPDHVPDPHAEKPEDWDVDMDGEWEPPLIPNPLCESAPGCGEWTRPMVDNPLFKGKWRPPLIDNPNYKGKWRPRRIANPDFFEDLQPFLMSPIAAVGFELWSMSDQIMFDNMIITDSLVVAEQYAADSFDIKRLKMDKQADSLVTRMMAYTAEYPWLWAIIIMVVGLPIVAFFIFCCGDHSKRPDSQADAKKTDAVAEDDPEPKKPASKGQLETQPDDDEEEEEDNEDDNKEEEEEEEEEEEASESTSASVAAADSSPGARRRRPRRE